MKLQPYLHGGEGGVFLFYPLCSQQLCRAAAMADEVQAVGQNAALPVEEGQLVHPFRQAVGTKAGRGTSLSVGRQCLNLLRRAAVQDLQAYFLSGLSGGLYPDAYPVALLRDAQCASRLLRFGEFRFVFVSAVAEHGLVASFGLYLGQDERAPPAVHGTGVRHGLFFAVVYREFGFGVLPVFVVQFEGHVSGQSGHERAPFGIELQVHVRFAFPCAEVPPQGAERHVLPVVAGSGRAVEHGEHARVEFVVVAEEVFGHLFIVEHLLGVRGMGMLITAEVQHPTRIGA